MIDALYAGGVPLDERTVSGSGAVRFPTETSVRSTSARPSKVCVVIATKGRPKTLARVVNQLATQTRRPDYVLVSATTSADVEALEPRPWLEVVLGKAGLARQRNAALLRLPDDVAYAVFFDDDFVAHPRWLELVEQCFEQRPSVVAITGHIAADGVRGPGLSFEDGLSTINACVMSDYVVERFSPYGCNMAFRRAAIAGLCFDERLVLYGWLEDRDFGGALAKRGGKLIKLGRAVGVHLGTKVGRMSGRRLGYSQIVNPLYLRRKGTMTTSSLLEHVFKNIVANAMRSFYPEPHVDRLGRLAGNVIAMADILRGRVAPERAEFL